MLRIATIGTNFITDRFLEAAGYCEGIAYTVTYSRNEETAKAFARKHGAKRYETDMHKLGTIRRVSFQFAKYSSRYDNFRQGVIENAFNPTFSNGALMDIGGCRRSFCIRRVPTTVFPARSREKRGQW